MKTTFMTVAIIVLMASTLRAQDIAGDWQGTLRAGAAELRVILHVASDDAGGFKATLDSLDQGAKGLPVTTVSRNGSSVKLTLNQLGGTFEGQIDAALTTITGTWTQGGGSLPLVFTRVKDSAQL